MFLFSHLSSKIVLQLSPFDLLNSREVFRQKPLCELPHINPGEVEACFAALISLYHVRKLLSSHGIKPAYDMLQEKLQQGYFLSYRLFTTVVISEPILLHFLMLWLFFFNSNLINTAVPGWDYQSFIIRCRLDKIFQHLADALCSLYYIFRPVRQIYLNRTGRTSKWISFLSFDRINIKCHNLISERCRKTLC